jgi:hypothetical protein
MDSEREGKRPYNHRFMIIVLVFIVGYCRTPLGAAFIGSLSHLTAPELASHAIRGIITFIAIFV